MKFAKNKRANLIASILLSTLMITLLVPLATTNTVHADLTFYPFIIVSPNPVGVGQRAVVVFGFTMPLAAAGDSYYDWTLTINDPSGNVQTITGLNTDATGSNTYTFNPDKVGNWTIKAHYPGGYAIIAPFEGNINESVPAADTNTVTLTVQAQPIPSYPNPPLPTSYWQFPIYGENQAWNQIAGNWLMSGYDAERDFDDGAIGGAFNPYTTVPQTAHILWTKQQMIGGIVGGATDMTYYTGSSYQRELIPPVIIDGRMIYNDRNPPFSYFTCVDLATGQTLWQQNATFPDGMGGFVTGRAAEISLGQVLTLNNVLNWHGGIPFLWSVGDVSWGIPTPTWAVWNANDGSLLFTIANATTPFLYGYPFGSFTFDNNTGTLMANIYDPFNDRLIVWNSTLFFDKTIGIPNLYSTPSNGPIYNLPWSAGVQLNVTVPYMNIPATAFMTGGVCLTDPKDPSVMIIRSQASGDPLAGQPYTEMAISLTDGHMLWNQTRNVGGTWETVVGGMAMSVSDNTYVVYRKETEQIYAYSVTTGQQKWVSDPRSSQWGIFFTGFAMAYGKVYCIAFDGMVYCYDDQTGKVDWTWGPVNAGTSTPYGVYPLYGGITVADNEVIVSQGQHDGFSPLYQGERTYVIDADNGTTLWSMDGWYQQVDAANGVLVAPNCYDGNIYCFGKGPSETSVTAPDIGVTTATPVTITGTVMDISPGSQQNAVAANFPHGLPCVSDASMSQFMAAVYEQQPMPTNITGVPVTLTETDHNGNTYTIGTTTTDDSGTFAYNWTPPIQGNYTIVASFAGSGAYWGSCDETHIYASSPAATAAPTASPPTGLATTSTVELGIVAVIIVIIIIGAVLALLMMRKHP
jgi:uncharacterized integral membrane protein